MKFSPRKERFWQHNVAKESAGWCKSEFDALDSMVRGWKDRQWMEKIVGGSPQSTSGLAHSQEWDSTLAIHN